MGMLVENIFAMFGWRVFSTDSMHSYGYKLCSSSHRLVPSFAWGIHHIGASQNDWENIYYTMLMLPKYSFSLSSLWKCFFSLTCNMQRKFKQWWAIIPPRSTNEQSPQIIEHKLHAKSKNNKSTSEGWFFKYYIYDKCFVFERTWCRLFLTCVVYT